MNLPALSEWVSASYRPAGPVRCRLLRSYTNDVYAVEFTDERFVLKVYGKGWRTESEIRYEIDLLQHLSAGGLPVAAPVAGSDDEVLRILPTPDGPRYTVLYAYAPGVKPESPFTPRLYRHFGRAIAGMHAISDDFATEHRRRSLDLSHLIDEPFALAAPLLLRREDREFFRRLAEGVKEAITTLASEGLDWGPIHGDATLDNLHQTADGTVTLYDFDSGGPGWRAADLQGWAAGSARYRRKWTAFLEGYSAIRPLKPPDLRAAPYLTIATDIRGIQIDLENRILQQGSERTAAYLSEQAALLRRRARTLRQVTGVP